MHPVAGCAGLGGAVAPVDVVGGRRVSHWDGDHLVGGGGPPGGDERSRIVRGTVEGDAQHVGCSVVVVGNVRDAVGGDYGSHLAVGVRR